MTRFSFFKLLARDDIRNICKLLLSIISAALLLSQPAAAQDDDDVEDIALLAALGLTAPDGTTTSGEGAGQLEAFILSANLSAKLGEKIREKIGTVEKTTVENTTVENTTVEKTTVKKTIVPLGSDQTLNLRDYYLVAAQLESLTTLSQAIDNPSICEAKFQKDNAGDGIESTDPKKKQKTKLTPADIFGLLRSDVEVKGVSVNPSEQMIINAVISLSPSGSDNWYLPSEHVFSGINNTDGIYAKLKKVKKRADDFLKGPCAKKDKAEDLKKIATDVQGGLNALITPGEKGAPSSFALALLREGLVAKADDMRVLRIKVEHAGGTLLTSNSILTQIGFPAVTMSGGLIVTYRLVNPSNGQVSVSGTFICSTPRRTLHNISRFGAHNNNKSKCSEPLSESFSGGTGNANTNPTGEEGASGNAEAVVP